MADGYLNFDTRIDGSGVDSGLDAIEKDVQESSRAVEKAVDETQQRINAILADSTRSMKSKAASIGAIYKAQGMDASSAMTKAWEQIERGAVDANHSMISSSDDAQEKIARGWNLSGKKISSGFSELKRGLLSLAKMAAAAFSVKALVDFGKQAVSLASDLQEVQNVVDTAFGDMSHKMEQFADTAIEMYGISKLTAKQTGSAFMAMASGMGIAAASASDMAVSLMGLSADMASFYNVAQDVSSTALKSIFTGETETLKRFGIVMTEANLQSFALSQGITKSLKAMTQAEKVQLRYNYVMAQTTLAQGDFAKTSGGWANQLRILSEQWKEFSTTIGQVLVQVLLPALNTLNSVMAKVVSWSQAAANSLADLFGWQLDASSAAGSMSSALAACADDYAAMADSAEAAATANERSLASFDEIHTIGTEESGIAVGGVSSSDVNTLTGAVDADAQNAESKLDDFIDTVKEKWQEAADYFADIGITRWIEDTNQALVNGFGDVSFGGAQIFDSLRQAMMDNQAEVDAGITALVTAFANGGMTIGTIIADMWAGAARRFAEFTTEYEPDIRQFFDNVVGISADTASLVGGIFNDLFTDLGAWWEDDGKSLWHDFTDALKDIGGWTLRVWNEYIFPVIRTVESEIGDLWDKHLRPCTQKFGEMITAIGELVDFLWDDYISPFVDRLLNDKLPIIKSATENMAKFFSDAFGVILDYFSLAMTDATGLIEFITDVFKGDWAEAWDTIKETFSERWAAIKNIAGGAINLVIDGVNYLITWLYNSFSEVVNGVGDIAGAIGDLIGQDWEFSVPAKPPQIPRLSLPALATGTIVPAGFGEFAAILGDNKREPEIVSPESYMKKAFLDALQESGITSGGGGTQIIKLVVDGRTLTEIVNRENRRSGRAGNGMG